MIYYFMSYLKYLLGMNSAVIILKQLTPAPQGTPQAIIG